MICESDRPFAYAVYYTHCDEPLVHMDYPREAARGNYEIIPLYRSPQTCPYVVGRTTLHCSLTPFTLTDAERQYITCQANRAWHNASEADARGDADWAKWHRDEERTLRGLLERTK
jgi:hypothetical protein